MVSSALSLHHAGTRSLMNHTVLSGKPRGCQRSQELSSACYAAGALNGAEEWQRAPIREEMNSTVLPAKRNPHLSPSELTHTSLSASPSFSFHIALFVVVNITINLHLNSLKTF